MKVIFRVPVWAIGGLLILAAGTAAQDPPGPCYHCQYSQNCTYLLCNPVSPSGGTSSCNGGCYTECEPRGGSCQTDNLPEVTPDGSSVPAPALLAAMQRRGWHAAVVADYEVEFSGHAAAQVRRRCDRRVVLRLYDKAKVASVRESTRHIVL